MTALKLIHIEEPLLEFRFGQKLVYPRDGLFLYGPVDGDRPEINYGVIGTPAGIALLERWTHSVAGLIPPPPPRPRAKLIEPQHIAFSRIFSGVQFRVAHQATYRRHRH
jgi:hypothetical protein